MQRSRVRPALPRARPITPCLLTLALYGPVAAVQEPSRLFVDDPELSAVLADVYAAVDEDRLALEIPGLSIAIVAGPEALMAEGSGSANLEKAAPATAETVRRVTAVMLMQVATATARRTPPCPQVTDSPEYGAASGMPCGSRAPDEPTP